MLVIWAVFTFTCVSGVTMLRNEDVTINLPNGVIQGKQLYSQNNQKFYAFLQIPYATPPIGHLRFKEPTPVRYWKGYSDTTKNTKICTKWTRALDDSRESEDCLYLNVFTSVKPGIQTNQTKLPVLFFIHGIPQDRYSFFSEGTYEAFGPEFLMDYDIIVVTINYRIGPFGFFTTDDAIIPANNGLKDQHMALKWVQENIDLFGGDPEKVTIAGHGFGAVCVGHHILSPKSQGFFRSAILQSGSALSSSGYNKQAKHTSYAFAHNMQTTVTPDMNSENLLKLMQKFSAEDIKMTDLSYPNNSQTGEPDIWSITTESTEGANRLVIGKMYENLRNGNITKVPILIGVTSEEEIDNAANLPLLRYDLSQFDKRPQLLVNKHYNVDNANITAAGHAIRKIYTEGLFQDDLRAGVRFYSDAKYTMPVSKHAELQSKHSNVYFYRFSYVGKLGGITNEYNLTGLDKSAGHSSELGYMWKYSRNNNLTQFSEGDLLTQKRLLKLWTNFITTMNPTPTKEDILENINWPEVTQKNFTYLDISDSLNIKAEPEEYRKWSSIVDAYGIPPFDSY